MTDQTNLNDAAGGVRESEPDYYDCGFCYGNGCLSCSFTGRIESETHREAREDYLDRKADAIRKGEW